MFQYEKHKGGGRRITSFSHRVRATKKADSFTSTIPGTDWAMRPVVRISSAILAPFLAPFSWFFYGREVRFILLSFIDHFSSCFRALPNLFHACSHVLSDSIFDRSSRTNLCKLLHSCLVHSQHHGSPLCQRHFLTRTYECQPAGANPTTAFRSVEMITVPDSSIPTKQRSYK